jgi:hypothetical protein
LITPQQIPFPIIRSLVEIYYDFQDQRIITESRLKNNSERNQINDEQLARFGVTELFKKAKSFENDIKTILTNEIIHYPIYNEWLSSLYGIGPIITAGLLANIQDISKFDNISKLWQYAGFGMNTYCSKCDEYTYIIKKYESKKAKKLQPFKNCPNCNSQTTPVIAKRMPGYMSNWNDKFKVLCWKVGQSFEKQGTKSSYYKLYKQIKEEEHRNHPEKIKENGKTRFNDGHLRNRALRKTIKIFLAHLWVVWRSIEGLEVSQPYVNTILGHDVISPFKDQKLRKVKK